MTLLLLNKTIDPIPRRSERSDLYTEKLRIYAEMMLSEIS